MLAARVVSGPRYSRFLPAGAMHVATFLIALALTAAILLARELLASLGQYSYPVVFLTSLLSSASLFFPGPGIALLLVIGGMIDPISLGLVAGLGAAVGEMTGYVIGYQGRHALEKKPVFRFFERWMRKAGDLALFSIAAIPNPFADVTGIVAGASGIPLRRFLFITWLGKSLRFILLAGLAS